MFNENKSVNQTQIHKYIQIRLKIIILYILLFILLMNSDPTVVTAFYNIRKMENDPEYTLRRNIDEYLDFAKLIKQPLIIFIDDECDVEFICDFIKVNRSNKTYIYKLSFKGTYFYPYLERITELRESYIIENRNYHHESPYYIILNNNKFDFMEKAIELNIFNSSHFVWIDFGINHVAQNCEEFDNWVYKIPDKIKQMCLNPYLEGDGTSDKQFFKFIYHHTSGGLFSGNIENMKKYIDFFKKKVDVIYNDDWYQIDEAIMTMVQRENLDLFDLYYGDYQGIISNYLRPIHNIDLIERGLEKAKIFNSIAYINNISSFLEKN